MKVLIDEISEFINKGWPGDDWYMKDAGTGFRHLTDDGEASRVPGTLVELNEFYCLILWGTLSVEIPKGNLEAVRAAIKAAGGKVLNA